MTKIESGKMEMCVEACDVQDLVSRAVERFATPARSKKVELTCEFEPHKLPSVMLDPMRTRQVVFNLCRCVSRPFFL